MRLRIDSESDALYFRLSDAPIVESEELRPGLIADYDEAGHLVGLEVLNASKQAGLEHLGRLEVAEA
ncbi:MAG TPA: DUF2283 domain-containing protein [Chloroflexota bacterium]|nr:DUF2283 domain-containing protein [Chloroflexota bacterium]